jgi:long-chain acyl-CoA synthetase
LTTQNPTHEPNSNPNPPTYTAKTVPELLQTAANNHPQSIALIYSDKIFNYQQLDVLSSQFATKLACIGVQKGDRVGVYLPNCPAFVIAYFGILKAGAVLAAVNPVLREREVAYQLADSGAESVVVLDSLLPILEQVKENTAVKNLMVVGADNDFAFSSCKSTLKQNVVETPCLSINASDLAALQYTGGTTGTPKAAMLTHQNLASNATAFAAHIRGKPAQETFLSALPLSHIYGLTTSLNVPVALAATIVLAPKFNAQSALKLVSRYQVSVFCGVPSMYQAMLACPELRQIDLGSLRLCISGASPLPVQVQQQFMAATRCLLVEGYGLTEASPVTHCGPVDLPPRFSSIGLPLPNTEARIVDAETGTTPLPIGETGELAVRGPQVMKGYWQNPQETARVLYDGWLLTGDLAHIDKDGYCYITDRKKDLIKHNGYSVYPRELEDLLYEHPTVQLCAVVGKPDPSVGENPKAYVILKTGAHATAQELKEFVNAKVAPYKAIRELEIRSELPLSSAGKILKRSLQNQEIAKVSQL